MNNSSQLESIEGAEVFESDNEEQELFANGAERDDCGSISVHSAAASVISSVVVPENTIQKNDIIRDPFME